MDANKQNTITNKPNTQRSEPTGKLELRKLWYVPDAKFLYALAMEFKVETAPTPKDGEEPDFESKDVKTEYIWNIPQGYTGDEEWAHRSADHFGIDFPTEEWVNENSPFSKKEA